MKQAKLTYVYDPMCSWCWGYRPNWLLLKQHLANVNHIYIDYCVGGLAPDSNVIMPENMQQFLQQTWQKIAHQLGTEFNFDFWNKCQPRRSTYPACRAALVAREHDEEEAMLFAIQQAYYLRAQNPSDNETLIALAVDVGLDETQFTNRIASDEIEFQLRAEIARTRHLPINGFPSLVLTIDNECFPIQLDYLHWQTSYQHIMSLITYESRGNGARVI